MYFLRDTTQNLLAVSHKHDDIIDYLAKHVPKIVDAYLETEQYRNLASIWNKDQTILEIHAEYIHSPIYSNKILETFTISEHMHYR